MITGLPGSGKTWLVERLVCETWRVVFFAPTLDDYRKPGRLVLTPAQLEEQPWILTSPHLRLVVVPEGDSQQELAAELAIVVRLLRSVTAHYVLVLDEEGDYSRSADGLILSVTRRSRHDVSAVIHVSQCNADIPLRARKMASAAYLLGQEHPSEIDEVSDVFGADVAARVAAWRPFDPPVYWTSATWSQT